MSSSPMLSPDRGARRARSALTAAAVLLASAALAVSSAGVADAAPQAASTAAAAAPAGRFIPTPLTRVLDTRGSGQSPFVGGDTRVVNTARAIAGTATAVVFNVTIVDPTGAGFLAAFPAGQPRPSVSNLNFVGGENRANMVTVAVGSGALQDDVAIYVAVSGRTDVVVDVLGYYGAGGPGTPVGTDYQPLAAPVRLFDTRSSIGPLTDTYPKNTGIVTVNYGSPAVNRTISAVVMTLTVTQPQGAGFLTVSDGGGASASVISWVAGQSIGNLAIVPVRCADAACNSVRFYAKNNGSPSTQLVGDIAGMYATPSPSGTVFTANSPVRVVDTRVGHGFGALASGGTGVTDVTSYSTPLTRAVAVNVQSVNPPVATWLTCWSTGSTKPATTNLNASAGRVDAIAAQVRLGAGDKFSTTAYWGPVDIVVDLAGTFANDQASAAASGAQPSSADAGTAAVSGAIAGT